MSYNKLNKTRDLISYQSKSKMNKLYSYILRIVLYIGYNELSVSTPCNRLLQYVKGVLALRIAPWNNAIIRTFWYFKAIFSSISKREAIPYNYIYFRLIHK